jgi:hypothetical protein
MKRVRREPQLVAAIAAQRRCNGSVVLSVALFAFFVVLTTAATSAGARSVRFGSPTLLDTGVIAGVAINARGEAVAVWYHDRVVRVARRRADGRWERPVTLDRGYRCRKNFRVAINARGDAVLGWSQNRGCYEGPTPKLLVSTRTERHGWSQPKAIVRTWGEPSLGISARGLAVLVWQSGTTIWTTNGHGTRWRAPSRLTRTYATGTELALKVHANGRAVAMWGGPSGKMVATRARTGGWAPAAPIPESDALVATLTDMAMKVSITSDGRILGAWCGPPGDGATLPPRWTWLMQVAEYRPTDGWSRPRTLGTCSEFSPVSLDMNDRGEAIMGWSRFEPSGHSEAITATRTRTGVWSSQRLSARPEISANDVKVGIAAGGQTFATWTWFRSGIKAATGTVSSGWRKRHTIPRHGNGQIAYGPQLAVADGPHAIIGWSQLRGLTVAVSVTR